ncbi:hypothetical protein [Chryseobacterium sp. EO14]|uniref:hypothetical protein n=1 Tax=Chryseobacterium sp. EO14 TaxID=2950551 RepID=UPI002108CA0E|nr:hypothetical protein [Chryseobacterium sp. EO14]MCQ4140627.1 hypothetical protein [Chryseobacterium sp. EO14]
MTNEIEQAINFCIEALNNKIEQSQEVKGNSEYVLATLNEIKKLPYEGRNLGIGDFSCSDYGGRGSFVDIIQRFGTSAITFSLSWLDALLLLFDFANYDEEEMLVFAQKIVNDDIIFNHVLKHIISNCVVLGDIKKAETFIPNFKTTVIFREEDNLDKGYLIILNHYAMRGDDKNFFKYFKQSKPTINKYEINIAKQFLVKNYAKNNGIEQTIELCKHKNLGTKLYFNALTACSEQAKYQELKQIFEKYPDLKQPELETELTILSEAYLKAKELSISIDDDFETLFDRTLRVNRKLKWGDIKLQDAIFFNLGLANKDNKERVILCRKNIKNNWLKKELVIK